ncbi:hypothetical protein PUN28_005861 [Cardiocondyla obscurior]|uniref:Uncharacterized protein n=1 Tax=Cardiocondyla obscurior TaxID=286306 RepID=A0AAW2G8U5_9HYME
MKTRPDTQATLRNVFNPRRNNSGIRNYSALRPERFFISLSLSLSSAAGRKNLTTRTIFPSVPKCIRTGCSKRYPRSARHVAVKILRSKPRGNVVLGKVHNFCAHASAGGSQFLTENGFRFNTCRCADKMTMIDHVAEALSEGRVSLVEIESGA